MTANEGLRSVAGRGDDRRGHRRDIQSLRAVAVSLVLVFHLWPDQLRGGYIGVDVFFVISGFLITAHLLAARPSTGRDLGVFWMRRIRRLLPAALLVLAAVLAASRAVAPDTQWRSTAYEAIASAFYVENWSLASRAVDYLAAETAPSPVQHYWSLSVEEQFYACWPILVLCCVLFARRTRRSLETTVVVAMSVVVAASLAYSVHATWADPARAYFVTPTRVWELGVGGLLAALLVRSRSRDAPTTAVRSLPDGLRAGLAWAGYAAIAWAAVAFTAQTPFPGYLGLLPVLGAAAVIAAHAQSVSSPAVLLSNRPVEYLGDISYSVYLWHWPLIVLLPQATGEPLSTGDKLAIVLASVVLAGLTKTFVEERFRRHPHRMPLVRPYQFAAAGMALVVAAASVQVMDVKRLEKAALRQAEAARSNTDGCFGAASMVPGNRCPQANSGPTVPVTSVAALDKSDAYADDCWVSSPFSAFKRCVYGDPSSETSIALVGNSHAGQWLPALQELAQRYRWKITTFLASECFATTIQIRFETRQATRNCLAWGKKVLAATTTGEFDLVITSERAGREAVDAEPGRSYPLWKRGFDEYLRQWLRRDANILVIRDNPIPGRTLKSIPDCIATNRQNFSACSAARAEWLNPDPLAQAAYDSRSPRARVVDLSHFFCDTVCRPVIGRALVYFDASHLTATYVRTLTPHLSLHVRRALARN